MDEITDIDIEINNEKEIILNDLKNNKIPSDIKKYNALFDYFKITELKNEDGEIISFSYCENDAKILKEKSRSGFFCLLTYKVDMKGDDLLNVYKNRDDHEKKFWHFKKSIILLCPKKFFRRWKKW